MKRYAGVFTAAVAVMLFVTVSWAQEHPEHPSNAKTNEPVTIDMLSKAIADYIKTDSKLKGGFFLVYDPVTDATLRLMLDKVHEDKLATLGGGVYFACADFKASDGRIYDLDIFMKGDGGGLEATEVSIHKVAGTPRYTWREDNGVWTKVAAKSK